jgi:hypothetical protein
MDGTPVSDPYETAEMYDCKESETLQYESEEEALESYLDGQAHLNCDMSELIREYAPIKVDAYVREGVSEKYIGAIAEKLLEIASDSFADDYGGPDGECDTGLHGTSDEDVLPDMIAVIKKYYAHATVWACRVVASRTYSAEEVEAKMREFCPEWFEGEKRDERDHSSEQ